MNQGRQQADAHGEGDRGPHSALAFDLNAAPAPGAETINCQTQKHSARQSALQQNLHVTVLGMREGDVVRFLQIKGIDIAMSACSASKEREIQKSVEVSLPEPKPLVG